MPAQKFEIGYTLGAEEEPYPIMRRFLGTPWKNVLEGCRHFRGICTGVRLSDTIHPGLILILLEYQGEWCDARERNG